MKNHFFLIGLIFSIIGFLLMFFSLMGKARKVEGGAMVFIGPFPIMAASSERVAMFMLIISFLMVLLTLLMFLTG